eukprot:m.114087 g.114087  ORF g.114087 m.114087 type:complete len:59 (-) comp12810_c0_seq1:2314-2490(-)
MCLYFLSTGAFSVYPKLVAKFSPDLLPNGRSGLLHYWVPLEIDVLEGRKLVNCEQTLD